MDRDRVIVLVGLQAMLLIALVWPVISQSNEMLYISIDCGSDQTYVDSATNITWLPDANFTSTGTNVQNVTVKLNSTVVNAGQATSLRYFDGPRSRHCYVVPLKPQHTYLLRVTLYIGDSKTAGDDHNFEVYINATSWLAFYNYTTDSAYDYEGNGLSNEAIFYSPGGQVNVCLLRYTGVAFISALEVRKLTDGMYPVTGPSKYLALIERTNAGAPPDSPFVRFPDDQFDRLWFNQRGYEQLPVSRISGNPISTSAQDERPPQKVMEDAWIATLSNPIFWSGDTSYSDIRAAIHLFFQEVDGSANASNVRGLELLVNGVLSNTFNVSDQPVEIFVPNIGAVKDVINITLQRTAWSMLPPIINAYEIYWVGDFNTSETNVDEANTIARIKELFNMTDWDGDPCVPIPFDWLGCQGNVSYTHYNNRISNPISTIVIANLTLGSFATTNMWTIPQEIGQLTALTELNLRNQGFSNIGTSLRSLKALTVLDLSNNNLTNDVADFNANFISPSVKTLKVANNSLWGQFSIDKLANTFPQLELANFDGNADINGSLDLTGWLASLNSIANQQTVHNPSVTQLISLRHNKIGAVVPSERDLTSAIEQIFNSVNRRLLDNGILLFGNPWCNQTTSNPSLARQYLCRPNTGTLNLSPATRDHHGALIGSIIGGTTLLICFILMIFILIRKLRSKSATLRDIQEALAKQKAHPSFYSYGALRAATNNFSSENKLGRGAYGAVFKGELADGTLVAVKKLFISKLGLSDFLNEAVLISGIKHKHLIQLRGCCIKEEQRMLIYEFAENGNLAEALWGKASETKVTLNWETRLNICIGIGRGLSYLHEELQPRIIHRDIKPENILIDANFDAKIADFGLARQFGEEQSQANYTHMAGTLGYFAPEYAFQGQLTEKADVFSFGIVLLEIVSGRKCIDNSLPEEMVSLFYWANSRLKQDAMLEILDPAAKTVANKEEMCRVVDVAFLCLRIDPALRPKMSEAVMMLQGLVDVARNLPEDSLSFQEKLANYISTGSIKFTSFTSSVGSPNETRLLLPSKYDECSTSRSK